MRLRVAKKVMRSPGTYRHTTFIAALSMFARAFLRGNKWRQ